ncbi:Os10g0367401 [Oryza sativa Japonica Group]|uniref:Os10g0367401 protein n=1 Tax=Oryza sativa subsp. japonica TaxID=39947 RepID=A0A0P0XTG0_ORYSJ|nr:Os10g0367401 [Oryza sativa Japonica Group]
MAATRRIPRLHRHAVVAVAAPRSTAATAGPVRQRPPPAGSHASTAAPSSLSPLSHHRVAVAVGCRCHREVVRRGSE